MTTWLTDDTWQSLDPPAARLTGGDRRGLAGIVAVAVVVLAAVAVGYRSGLLAPRLSAVPETVTAHDGSRAFTRTVDVHNEGSVDEQVRSVAGRAPGIRLVSAAPQRGRIPAGHSLRLTLHYVVTDCGITDEASAASFRLGLDRPWGTAWVTLDPDGSTGPDAGVLAQVCANP